MNTPPTHKEIIAQLEDAYNSASNDLIKYQVGSIKSLIYSNWRLEMAINDFNNSSKRTENAMIMLTLGQILLTIGQTILAFVTYICPK